MAEEEILKQHVVSRVLLKRWAVNGLLSAFDVQYRTVMPRSPGAEGFITGYTKYGATELEKRWGAIEQEMPGVFEAIEAGEVFDDEQMIITLKDFFALHSARSRTTQEVFLRVVEGRLDELLATSKIYNDHAELDEHFINLTGLYPAGLGARLYVREKYVELALQKTFGQGSEFFAERVEENFHRVRELLDGVGLQLGVTDGADLVIGDDPVQTVNVETKMVGILSGVPMQPGTPFFLPLGPRHVVAPDKTNNMIEIDAPGAAQLNRIQIITAHRKVYFRPGAEMAGVITTELSTQAQPQASGDGGVLPES